MLYHLISMPRPPDFHRDYEEFQRLIDRIGEENKRSLADQVRRSVLSSWAKYANLHEGRDD
jgi:hypothetical protein